MREAYTDEELKEIYADWKKSKESQKEYCIKHEINGNVFKSDIYQLRKREQKKGQFNVVKVKKKGKKDREEEAYCEVRFSGGHVVSFSNKASILGLKSLISDLIQG